MNHPLNKSCEKNFDRIDKNVDDLEKKLDENGKKLTALETSAKNISSDHDQIVILGGKVENLETNLEKNINSVEKVTSNMNNFAALQNNMIDKLTDLTKREDKKNDVKMVIIAGVLVTVIGAIILFVLQVFVTHSFKVSEDANSSKTQVEKINLSKATEEEKEMMQILRSHIKNSDNVDLNGALQLLKEQIKKESNVKDTKKNELNP